MNGLKYTSVCSIFSTALLGLAIAVRSYQSLPDRTAPEKALVSVTAPADWLVSFPICCVSFLCHFNVLPMHEELADPTRKRIRTIVHGTMSIATVFYLVVGIFGYLYAFNDSEGCDPISCYGIQVSDAPVLPIVAKIITCIDVIGVLGI
jgi:amino acid permease